MKQASILLFLLPLLLLFSCAAPQHLNTLRADTDRDITKRSQLYRIHIKSFWQDRFTGLLALKRGQHTFRFALLDATGITLLDVEVADNGNYHLHSGMPRLVENELPEILSRSLIRIFFIEPDASSCKNHLWSRLCRKNLDENSQIKYFRNGPFTHWQSVQDAASDEIRYNQPWVGFSLQLSPLPRKS